MGARFLRAEMTVEDAVEAFPTLAERILVPVFPHPCTAQDAPNRKVNVLSSGCCR
jgi:hypothetical protein